MSLQPCMRIRAAIILITEKRLTTAMMALAMAVKMIVHQDEPCLWHLACAGDRHSDGFSIGHNNPNMDSAGWKFWTWGRKMVRVSLVVVSWWLHYFYDVARMVLKEIWEDMALAVLALKGVSVTLVSLVIQPICSAYTTRSRFDLISDIGKIVKSFPLLLSLLFHHPFTLWSEPQPRPPALPSPHSQNWNHQ